MTLEWTDPFFFVDENGTRLSIHLSWLFFLRIVDASLCLWSISDVERRRLEEDAERTMGLVVVGFVGLIP